MRHAHFVADDQAFEMLAAIEVALGEHRASRIEEHRVRQLVDFERASDVFAVDERLGAEVVPGDVSGDVPGWARSCGGGSAEPFYGFARSGSCVMIWRDRRTGRRLGRR